MDKVCTKCGESKLFSDFYKKKGGNLVAKCILCVNKDNTDRYWRNKSNGINKKRSTYNKEAVKKYLEKNKDKISAKRKERLNSPKGRYATYAYNAKYRDIAWELSQEEFETFWQRDCFLLRE